MTDTDSQTHDHKARVETWFKDLRDQICSVCESIEDELTGTNIEQQPGRFEQKSWDRANEDDERSGGGMMSIMRGRVFEKIGVNISTVEGTFSEEFRKSIPGAAEDGKFWASGISLVAHMCSPLVPDADLSRRGRYSGVPRGVQGCLRQP
jgi:coproporphyrinogen III oxidase